MEIQHLNESNFDKALASEKPILIDFYAGWCSSCKMISPLLEEIAKENTNVNVCKVDVDESADIANHYGVMSVPTLMVFDKKRVKNKAVGYISKDEINQLLQ
ncbi:MAG: thioredoxin [Bacillota bacterium]|nr:thioredoxin [Bacillota bacterium]